MMVEEVRSRTELKWKLPLANSIFFLSFLISNFIKKQQQQHTHRKEGFIFEARFILPFLLCLSIFQDFIKILFW